MKEKIHDTHPKIEKMMIEGYRKMTPGQKLQKVIELNKSIRQLALARIKEQYGNISEMEQRLRLASLWLSRETMMKVFDWDPRVEGY